MAFPTWWMDPKRRCQKMTQLDESLRSFALDLGVRGHLLDLGESSQAFRRAWVPIRHHLPLRRAVSPPHRKGLENFLAWISVRLWDLDAFGGTSMMIRDDLGFKRAETWEASEISSFKHPQKTYCITLVGNFGCWLFPFAHSHLPRNFIILTWRKIHWASLPKKYSTNQPFQLTLMFPFSMLSFAFQLICTFCRFLFVGIYNCGNMDLGIDSEPKKRRCGRSQKISLENSWNHSTFCLGVDI